MTAFFPKARRVLSSLLLGLALWEGISRLEFVPRFLFPPPTRVLLHAWLLTLSGELPRAMGISLLRLAAGYCIGASAGAGAGLLCAASRRAEGLLGPWVDATFAVPKMAYIPFFILLLGMGEPLCLAIIALGTFFQLVVSIRSGASCEDSSLAEAVRNLGGGRLQVLREVTLPSLRPYVFLGLHLGLLNGIRMTVMAEALLSMRGIGYKVWLSGEWMNVENYYAYIMALGALALLATSLLRKAARAATPWASHENR